MYYARLKLGTGVLLQNPESLAELEREVACTAAPWLVVRTLPKPVDEDIDALALLLIDAATSDT